MFHDGAIISVTAPLDRNVIVRFVRERGNSLPRTTLRCPISKWTTNDPSAI